jgi:hypothetical protein
MRACRRLVATVVALGLLGALAPAPGSASDGFHVTGLRAVDGLSWHPYSQIQVVWDPNAPGTESEIWFAILDGSGAPLPGYDAFPAGGLSSKFFDVPPVPGRYFLEATQRRADGRPTTQTSVQLNFDDVRPGPVPITAPAWVAAGAVAPIHVSPPLQPAPVSGIQGYAVTIDGASTGSPCARADVCAGSEIDLRGGAAVGSIDLPAPPEGVSYVHAVAVSGSGMRSAATTTVKLGVDGTPPQVRLEGAPAGWAAGPVTVNALADDRLSGMAATGSGEAATAIAVDDRPPHLTPGATASATVAGEGTHKVTYWARDAVGNAGDGSLPFAKPGIATVRIDETDPTVHFAAGDPGDPERIEAVVADALSGPDPARGQIALRRVGSTGRFQPLPTAVDRGRLVARWNSDDFPRGPYEFRAVGFDAAGNSAATTAAPGGGPLVLRNPVKREARLAFGFGGRRLVFQRCAREDGARRCHRAVVSSFAKRPAARAVPCCHAAVVGGRLRGADGGPLAGQAVDVVETFARGSRNPGRHTTVTTDADGAFEARLPPGPSRKVSAEFAGTHQLTRAAGRSLRLRVRAGIRLRVSTTRVRVGGAPVVFRGRVLHPESRIPKTGLPVELEFRLPGTAWSEFRTLQTAPDGHFAYPYSFSDDDSSGVRFLFRAFVPATGNWPFAPTTSRPLAVTG